MLPVVVHPSRRSLSLADGSPFFYLGDTAWELFHRCTLAEANIYLRDRAAKGFNVIQAVALAELDGLRDPNPNGDVPFDGLDPRKPVEAYWRHVDAIITAANDLGIRVALLPTWGDKWNRGSWGKGPEIFTPENAGDYGRWIGARYRDAGIIWVVGGDRAIQTDHHAEIIRTMALGLREGDGGRHPVTYHPWGGTSSSRFVGAEPWFDFNMVQTGHDRDRDSWGMITADFEAFPRRPVINGEPCYEAIGNGLSSGDKGWLDQADVRRELYTAICAGAAGFTYGCNAIWQMFAPPREPVLDPRAPWMDSLGLPGASQVRFGAALALSRPLHERVPEPALVKWPQVTGPAAPRACRDTHRRWAFVYLPEGQRVKLALELLDANHLTSRWLNPRTGAWSEGPETGGRQDAFFTPPFDPEGRDWLLVLEAR